MAIWAATQAWAERVRMADYPLTDHFAERLHAYVRPREHRTRVEDLLDLSAIVVELADGLRSPEEMRRTLEATFDRYGTHAMPDPLPAPPEDWARPAPLRELPRKGTAPPSGASGGAEAGAHLREPRRIL